MSVVISGLGLVTAYGVGVRPFWTALTEGEVAVGPVRRFDASAFSAGVAAECLALPPDRAVLAAPAVAEALSGSGLAGLPPRTLVVSVAQAPAPRPGNGSTALSAFSGPGPEDLPGLPGTAEFLTVSHACASVAFGLLLARDWLAAGLVDAALLVGATFLNPCEYAGMDVTRALSATGLRPFDEDRDGTCLGEGAGAVVLERAADAARRGHTPLATVAGGNGRISPEAGAASDLGTVEACLAAALAEAGDPSVDYVHAHATGTPQGDLVELQALGHLAAEYAWTGVPVGSHKGGVGHLMQSAGFPALAAAVTSLRTGVVPGSPGLVRPIPAGDRLRLPVTSEVRPVRTALVDSFGFGGNIAALVLSSGEPS